MEIILHYKREHLAEIHEANFAERLQRSKKEFQKKAMLPVFIFTINMIILAGLRNPIVYLMPAFAVLWFTYLWYKHIYKYKISIAKQREVVSTNLVTVPEFKQMRLDLREEWLSLFIDDIQQVYWFSDQYAVYLFPGYIHFFNGDGNQETMLLPRKAMTDQEFDELSEALKYKMEWRNPYIRN